METNNVELDSFIDELVTNYESVFGGFVATNDGFFFKKNKKEYLFF